MKKPRKSTKFAEVDASMKTILETVNTMGTATLKTMAEALNTEPSTIRKRIERFIGYGLLETVGARGRGLIVTYKVPKDYLARMEAYKANRHARMVNAGSNKAPSVQTKKDGLLAAALEERPQCRTRWAGPVPAGYGAAA